MKYQEKEDETSWGASVPLSSTLEKLIDSKMIDKPVPEPIKILHTLDIVCFSHLRCDFVFQRPQHLLTPICSIAKGVFY